MLMSEFHEKGYTICEKMIEPELLDSIVATVKAPFENIMQNWEIKSMQKLFEEMPEAFMNCTKHAQWNLQLHHLGVMLRYKTANFMQVNPLVNICTRPVIYFNNLKTAKNKINHTTPAHIDAVSMQGSKDAIVCWVPLIELTEQHGLLEVVEGSHKWDASIKEFNNGFGTVDEDWYTFKPVEVKKGDVLVFSSHLVHRSGKLANEKVTRWSAHFRYNNMHDADFISKMYPHPYEYKNIDLGQYGTK